MKKNAIKFKSQLKPANIHKVFVNTGCDVSYETIRKVFPTTKASRKRKPTTQVLSVIANVIKSNIDESEWKENFDELDTVVSGAEIPPDCLLFKKPKKVRVEKAPAPDANVATTLYRFKGKEEDRLSLSAILAYELEGDKVIVGDMSKNEKQRLLSKVVRGSKTFLFCTEEFVEENVDEVFEQLVVYLDKRQVINVHAD